MNTISHQTLKEWNQQGFIPGPEETKEDFIKRVQFCLKLEQELTREVGVTLPFDIHDKASQNILEEANQITTQLYDIRPSWIPLFFSNYQLAPWHGGCAWIFQIDEHTPTAAFLQLRARFRQQKAYLGLYKRDELIAHEIAHVGRMMYDEPQFEEILAYQASSSKWRKWLGPIVQSSKESMLFILILGVILMADLALLVLHQEQTLQVATWLKWIPIGLIILALGRLGWRQSIFHRSLHHLTELYGHPQTARHLLYRLKDEEIRAFATLSPAKIQDFIQNQQSFRWQFLNQIYSSNFRKTNSKKLGS